MENLKVPVRPHLGIIFMLLYLLEHNFVVGG